jgi:hypothetical protein
MAFIESLELLSDYGAKMFKSNFGSFIEEIHNSLTEKLLNDAEANILRQIALNFTYELQNRILRSPSALSKLIELTISSLVFSG